MQERLPRGAGILLPVSSLPSPYGIGTLGRDARAFIDYLKLAGQRYWQVLPVGPTSYGDSPYQSFSAFAGNPYFIDLELLLRQGLLRENELEEIGIPVDSSCVDYEALYLTRLPLLRRAYVRFRPEEGGYASFCWKNRHWIEDYALSMALKGENGGREWLRWEEPLRHRKRHAMEEARRRLADDIGFWKFCQYQFYRQWRDLRHYAASQGIRIIGDMPLYVAQDSADVWSHPELFELGGNGHPLRVAGVPPDLFSKTGQRWGNPLYDWKRLEETAFDWWRRRMEMNASRFDVTRIDHFIGIARYYAIPASCETAVEGRWIKGPGRKLTSVLDEAAGDSRILAEDLGVLHPAVKQLLERCGYPGMKVLLFAFDGGLDNDHLPHRYKRNQAVYGGTHDNETIAGYCARRTDEELRFLMEYLGVHGREDIPRAMLRAAYASVADLAVFQAQDLLELDNTARMNEPSTLGGNWRWRLLPGQLTEELAQRLRKLAVLYER